MSNDSRKYRLRARAERQQETRTRIVAATAALHAEVGPARTTVAEIARRAGVQRLTVYNHFPEAGDLFAACQGHFLGAHPLPELAPREGVAPLAGLRATLADLYGWFRANEAMERNVHRDRHLVPELDALLRAGADAALRGLADAHAALVASGRDVERVRPLVRLAFEFRTWEVLSADGATDEACARLMAAAIGCTTAAR